MFLQKKLEIFTLFKSTGNQETFKHVSAFYVLQSCLVPNAYLNGIKCFVI